MTWSPSDLNHPAGRPWWALLGVVPALGGCGWLTDGEVRDWLHGTTCDGGATLPGATGCVEWYADEDGDGYGSGRSQCRCGPDELWPAPTGGDCDDADAAVHPGAVEVCDDLLVDEDCDAATPNGEQVWYADVDGDGWGSVSAVRRCAADDTYRASLPGDCDDADGAVNPEAEEVCDGVDNDCEAGTSEDGLATVEGGPTLADLQATVDAAPAGGVVRVCAGTWAPVQVEQDLRLVAVAGPEATALDGEDRTSAIVVAGGTVRLEGFTLTRGAGTAIGGGRLAGGGALVVAGAALELAGCVVDANRVDGDGAGIYADGQLSVEDSLLYDNLATGTGGAVHAGSAGVLLVNSNLFYNQAATGAGLHAEGGDITLTGSRIAGNFGDFGGGLSLAGTVTVRGGTVTSNGASFYGGGVVIDAGTGIVTLEGVSLSDNIVVTDGGGGVGLVSGTLVSEGSSWVQDTPESCPLANYPNDVYTAAAAVCAGDAADFQCTPGGCSGAVTSDCDCIR